MRVTEEGAADSFVQNCLTLHDIDTHARGPASARRLGSCAATCCMRATTVPPWRAPSRVLLLCAPHMPLSLARSGGASCRSRDSQHAQPPRTPSDAVGS